MPAENAPPPSESRDVVLETEPVELYKILKFEALVSSGGEAKMVIDDGLVFVNGELETRRRRKIRRDDVIDFDSIRLTMVVEHDAP